MAVEPPTFTCAVRAVADQDLLDQVHKLIAQLCAATGLGEERLWMFETAVAEVAANIVEHGVEDRLATVTLTLAASEGRVEAIFEDDGSPVDVDLGGVSMPEELAERGRGLAIAASVLDVLEYQRVGGVNTWRLVLDTSTHGA